MATLRTVFWNVFLIVYTLFLFLHVREMGIHELWQGGILLVGLLVAIFAHRTTHVLSILFLGAHMTLEAIEYGAHGSTFTTGILVWVVLHVAMDLYFLWGEISRHFYRYRRQFFSAVVVIISFVYFFIPAASTGDTVHTHESWISFLVIGGVIGCVLSHLIPHRHAHKEG